MTKDKDSIDYSFYPLTLSGCGYFTKSKQEGTSEIFSDKNNFNCIRDKILLLFTSWLRLHSCIITQTSIWFHQIEWTKPSISIEGRIFHYVPF